MKSDSVIEIISCLSNAGKSKLANKIVSGIVPGIPDGTGPFGGTNKCQLNDGKYKKGIVIDIERETIANNNFRKVLYTADNLQLVLMSLIAGEDIGEEVHEDTDQFFRIDKGDGTATINGKTFSIKDGSAFIVPKNAKHNVIAGKSGLKLYSIYSPPHHEDGIIHKTKGEAEQDNEHFDGKTTE